MCKGVSTKMKRDTLARPDGRFHIPEVGKGILNNNPLINDMPSSPNNLHKSHVTPVVSRGLSQKKIGI